MNVWDELTKSTSIIAIELAEENEVLKQKVEDQKVNLIKMRECLGGLSYWHEKGNIDDSWWEQALELLKVQP